MLILLCSDGLHGVVGEDDMKKALSSSGSLEAKSKDLISLARSRGARTTSRPFFCARPEKDPGSGRLSFTSNQITCYSQFLYMRTVDLIHQKRDGEELSPEDIASLVTVILAEKFPTIRCPRSSWHVLFGHERSRSQCDDERMIASGESVDLSGVPGVKVDKHSTGGVGDKTTLVARLLRRRGSYRAMTGGRAQGVTRHLDKLEAIPGMRTNLSTEEFVAQLNEHKLAFAAVPAQVAPADTRLQALRDATATVEASACWPRPSCRAKWRPESTRWFWT